MRYLKTGLVLFMFSHSLLADYFLIQRGETTPSQWFRISLSQEDNFVFRLCQRATPDEINCARSGEFHREELQRMKNIVSPYTFLAEMIGDILAHDYAEVKMNEVERFETYKVGLNFILTFLEAIGEQRPS